jgi:hypothetical protein
MLNSNLAGSLTTVDIYMSTSLLQLAATTDPTLPEIDLPLDKPELYCVHIMASPGKRPAASMSRDERSVVFKKQSSTSFVMRALYPRRDLVIVAAFD